MLKLIVFITSMSYAVSSMANCTDLFIKRSESRSATDKAIDCFSKLTNSNQSEDLKSDTLIKLSYLSMFKSEFYLKSDSEKILELEKAMAFAENGALVFGRLFDLSSYEKLSEIEKDSVARALYFYGTATARYVEYKGKLEAIRRLSLIKRTMNTVIRLGREKLEHYGAHRTLAILNAKVPVIAGGDKALARKYFEIAITKSQTGLGVSSYPLNNLMFAEFLFESSDKNMACTQLKKVTKLSITQIESLDNDYTFESINDLAKAKKRFSEYGCH